MIGVKVTADIKRMERILSRLEDELQFAAYDAAIPAATKIVVAAAAKEAPRSAQNPKGGREKQTAEAKATWGTQPLYTLISSKKLKGRKNGPPAMGLVGARHEGGRGNVANFVHPMAGLTRQGTNTRKHVPWGNKSSATTKMKENDYLKRAVDTTRSQQRRAFAKALIRETRKRLARYD